MFLSEDACNDIVMLVETAYLHYNWLTCKSIEEKSLRYNFTIKAHMLMNLILFSKWLNTRFYWAYTFEAMMGVVTRCARSCAPGTPLIQIGAKCMESYRLAFGIKYGRQRAFR